MKRGSKSLRYRWNKRRLRHRDYGGPVSTIIGPITGYELYMAHKVLSGEWSWKEYEGRKDRA